MSKKTKTQLETEIAEIDSAMQALLTGKRLNRLTVGSGDFASTYGYSEITYDNLKDHRDKLCKELDLLEPSMPNFRNSFVAVNVTKFGYN